jgi:hypothetical protein
MIGFWLAGARSRQLDRVRHAQRRGRRQQRAVGHRHHQRGGPNRHPRADCRVRRHRGSGRGDRSPDPSLADVVVLLREMRDVLSADSTEVLDPKGAAAFCKVSVAAWNDLHSRGMCPAAAYVSERCPRWLKAELRSWLLAGCPSLVRWKAMRTGEMRRVG